MNVRQLLDAMGFASGDHDKDARAALEELRALRGAMDEAWGIIANAGGGDWLRESEEWQREAAKWRDRRWARMSWRGESR